MVRSVNVKKTKSSKKIIPKITMSMTIGSSTNGSASDGHVIIPNLGYKKDAFLEPSLASNIHFSHLA